MSAVLSADDPAVYFTSSGTTGKHKKIPVTPAFMRHTFFPFYFAAWAPLIEAHPDVLERPDAVLNLKHDPLSAPPVTASGLPHVGASQVDFGAKFGEPLSAEPGTGAPWGVLPVPVEANEHLEKAYLRPTYRWREKLVRRLERGGRGQLLMKAYRRARGRSSRSA